MPHSYTVPVQMRRKNIFGVMILFATLNSAASLSAQSKTQSVHECEDGVKLRLSSPAGIQGSLLRFEIISGSPLTDLQAEWSGHPIPFWSSASRQSIHQALLGIDLELKPGPDPLSVSAHFPDGRKFVCTANINIRAGRFVAEHLKVENQFVEVNPKDRERADEEHKRLHEIFIHNTPERLWNGRFRVPLDGNHKGANFGRRRILNGHPSAPHTGVDFPAPSGTPVHASQRGRVVIAEPLFFSGNTVILDHGLGVYTFYGHLKSIDVAAGEMVEKGKILGLVGATGRVTGPHLHWGLTVNQSRVNALQLLALPAD
ncbi:MAG: M23 family metallopeptidase [Candidatus Acidiferrales bacterium]